MKKLIIFVLVFVLVISCGESVFGATKVFDYGFEDWTGDADTTPGYPITSAYQEYWDIHKVCTEAVVSYDADDMSQNWTAHSGTNFLLYDRSDTVELNPLVPGISCTSVNSYSNLGGGFDYGGQNKINLANAITTGELFIRFWARFNKGHYGNFTGSPYPGMKTIRVHNDDPDSGADIFMSLSIDNPPWMYIWQTSSGGDHGRIYINDAYDGNWHKFSMYVDFNNGIVRQWYDVDNEIVGNATQTWDNGGPIGSATHVTYLSLKGNFAAKYPLDEIYSGLDDIEIWDGMPTSQPECNDTIDNDGDGAIDFSGGDTGCDDANDDDESNCGDLV
ncbi:MAG: hypothetical protein ABIG69_18340, partial [Bacteroidota bacterium]